MYATIMSEEFLVLDLSRTCRTCLTQSVEMHPINNSIKTAQNNNIVIKDMILSCTQLPVSDNDGLPTQVCLKCVCRVSDAYLFKQNCERTDKALREYILNKTNDSAQPIPEESASCETFKENVMTLIHLAVDNGNKQSFTTENEQCENKNDNKINSMQNICDNNNTNGNDLENQDNTTVPKLRRKRKKKLAKLIRPIKMVKIAPKQCSFDSALSNGTQGKFLTIPMPGNNIMNSEHNTKIAKLPENIEIRDQCKICGIYFINEHELKSHLNDVHGLNDSTEIMKYICAICNIEFSLYDKFNEHNILEHYKDSTLQCDECLNYYPNKHILNRHKRSVHNNLTEELSCEICKKTFDSVRGLSIHKAFHNVNAGEKKIFCKICDRGFNIMSNLTYHMKYHKTNICQYCNQGFCNTSMMKTHMKEVHVGNKPYHCSYCVKRFNLRKALLRHKRIAHSVFDDVYFCGICKNSKVGFVSHEFLMKHIEKYHKLTETVDKDLYDTSNMSLKSKEQEQQNKIDVENSVVCVNVPENEGNLCTTKELSFNNIHSNISQLIDLTNEVNASQIIMNYDGTINIAINETDIQSIQVSEDNENLNNSSNFSLGETIENTIKVLKQEMFNDNKNETNFCITEMGGYTINEINTEEENVMLEQNAGEPSEQAMDVNDISMHGKIIAFDEEKQQYTICYDGAEYIISSEGLGQSNNVYFEVAEMENYDSNVGSNNNDENNCTEIEKSTEMVNNDLICKLCNVTFIDQTSYNDHVPKHNNAARGLGNQITMQESIVENSEEIKDGMIRININDTTGIVEHKKTDLIFAKHDYASDPVSENKIDVPRYRCPKCDDLFTRQYSLNRHLAHTHNEMCLVCNTCGEGFNRIALLEQHRLKHKNMLNLGVIITSVEETANKDDGNEAQNAIEKITESLYVYESENRSYSCEFCNKTFQKQIYLERHRLSHLGISQPGFMCSICNKFFMTAVDMQKHRHKHNEEYLQCNLCDRTFTTLGGLKYHLKTHTGTKNHKCPFCGKKFTANINLNAHIKTVHSEVKPHLCNICGKRYTTSDHLRKHMVYHTGERKFRCGVCGRDFTQNSHLTQHSWIHSGIKPHACKHCDNKYTSSSALKKHMQNNHLP